MRSRQGERCCRGRASSLPLEGAGVLFVFLGPGLHLAALALFDDTDRAADVMTRINKEGGRPAGDTFKACNAGAHGKLDVVPIDLIRNTEKLARWMQGLQ